MKKVTIKDQHCKICGSYKEVLISLNGKEKTYLFGESKKIKFDSMGEVKRVYCIECETLYHFEIYGD